MKRAKAQLGLFDPPAEPADQCLIVPNHWNRGWHVQDENGFTWPKRDEGERPPGIFKTEEAAKLWARARGGDPIRSTKHVSGWLVRLLPVPVIRGA